MGFEGLAEIIPQGSVQREQTETPISQFYSEEAYMQTSKVAA